MAGPIGNFFDQMAQNRHNGRGLIPTLLRLGFQPPVTYQEGIKSVEQYVPEESKRGGMFAPQWSQPGPVAPSPPVNEVIGDSDPAKPAFASLSGSSTARHDHLGAPGLKYPARMVAMDMADPDTEPNRPDRIDGKDPVTSSNSMPEPVYPTDNHRQRALAMQALERIEGEMGQLTGDPRVAQQRAMQAQLATQRAAFYDREIQRGDTRSQAGLPAAIGQLKPILDDAVQTGNFQALDGAAISMFGKTDKEGLPINPDTYNSHGRKYAEVPVLLHARDTLMEYGGLASAPVQKQVAVTNGIAYVYPWNIKQPGNVYERKQYVDGLAMRLNAQINQSGDTEMADYLRALAAIAAYKQHPWDK